VSRGKPIVNLFPLADGERINAVLPVKTFDEDRFVFMATAQGTVKKTPLSDFSRRREKGIIGVDLEEGDYLIGVAITGGSSDVMLFSDAGKTVRFEETDVRPMGRVARGVRGMKLTEGSRVISMLVADDESKSVLTATENGFGKRTPVAEYPRHGRGTQGVIAIQTTERNGKLIGAVLVDENDEVMLVSTGGVLIRTAAAQISKMGRSTQGVSLINLDPGTKLAGIEKIAEPPDDNGGNGADQDGGEDEARGATGGGNGEDRSATDEHG
jgi:DNA gyrase subunit A